MLIIIIKAGGVAEEEVDPSLPHPSSGSHICNWLWPELTDSPRNSNIKTGEFVDLKAIYQFLTK